MRILIVSDAWKPQVNGVVRTLEWTLKSLAESGHIATVLGPNEGISLPCPTYPEIRLSLRPFALIRNAYKSFQPDAIHIATEGPLGLAARFFCQRHGLAFTTSFHTKFPEYVEARCGLPAAWMYSAVRWFHSASQCVLTTTPTMERELRDHGFENLQVWSRGVDTELFRPRPRHDLAIQTDQKVALYVGRVAVEKNLEDFLSLPFSGVKYVVGDGPQLPELKEKYPDVHFVGARFGVDLARYYASADVFVFPSRTDTFGLVLLEALACGVPVAAYPVPGPLDVIGTAPVGCLHNNLSVAVEEALKISRTACRDHAMGFSWSVCTQQFLRNLCKTDQQVATTQTETFKMSGAIY